MVEGGGEMVRRSKHECSESMSDINILNIVITRRMLQFSVPSSYGGYKIHSA